MRGRQVKDDSQDSTLFSLQSLFGHIERADIVKRTSEGRLEKATQGIALGQGIPPYGYEKFGDRKNTRLSIVPGEAAVIMMIYEMFVQKSISITDIYNFLNIQEYPSPSQARSRIWQTSKWNHNSVLRILRDSRVIGEFYAFKYITHKVEGTMIKRAVLREKELQIKQYFPDLAIIDRELYLSAQEIIDSRKNRYTFIQSHEYLFNKHIVCACGHKAGVQTMKKNDKAHSYYRCAMKRRIGHNNHECKIPYLNSSKLDNDA